MLLTQNREMRADKVWNWTLPAWVITLPDGRNMNVCPNAGACAKVCYARNGTYLFPTVRAKHMSNLEAAMSDDFADQMLTELHAKKMRPTGTPRIVPGLESTDHLSGWVQQWLECGGQAVRIHDSGDFFSEEYLIKWIEIAWECPNILFYAYTKEVEMIRSVKPRILWPSNLLTIYSMGGKQDHLIDPDVDRHADVFPDLDAIEAAGYMSQHESDLLSVLLPTTRVGIPQNNIPHFKKRLDGRTFSEAQKDRARK
jgi:hypothetical protein